MKKANKTTPAVTLVNTLKGKLNINGLEIKPTINGIKVLVDGMTITITFDKVAVVKATDQYGQSVGHLNKGCSWHTSREARGIYNESTFKFYAVDASLANGSINLKIEVDGVKTTYTTTNGWM